ncbi:MAG: MAPEG family protein [Rhodospirillales bacterium]|nr:MAPEG family protein [Alphaproteobacteria bacterium]MCB9986520.1 MAPEG family protein [Rhodospirillales bacterium]USO06943.1 MAG: MAPEG family protein [Rhodospirillales bacterium]
MVTGLYAGILALVYAVLSFQVVRARIRLGVSFGDNGDTALIRTVRTHGNFAEYAPFTLLLMGLYELQAGSLYVLHGVGVILLAGRFLHILGLKRDIMPARAIGTVLTLGLMAGLGIALILDGTTFMTPAG